MGQVNVEPWLTCRLQPGGIVLLHAENMLDTVSIMSDFIDDAKTSGDLARKAGS